MVSLQSVSKRPPHEIKIFNSLSIPSTSAVKMRIQSTNPCGCLSKMTWMTSLILLWMTRMKRWKVKPKVN